MKLMMAAAVVAVMFMLAMTTPAYGCAGIGDYCHNTTDCCAGLTCHNDGVDPPGCISANPPPPPPPSPSPSPYPPPSPAPYPTPSPPPPPSGETVSYQTCSDDSCYSCQSQTIPSSTCLQVEGQSQSVKIYCKDSAGSVAVYFYDGTSCGGGYTNKETYNQASCYQSEYGSFEYTCSGNQNVVATARTVALTHSRK